MKGGEEVQACGLGLPVAGHAGSRLVGPDGHGPPRESASRALAEEDSDAALSALPTCLQVTVLVICHTRELAFQISKEYERFSKYMPSVKVSPLSQAPRGPLQSRQPRFWPAQCLPSLAAVAAFEVCGTLCSLKA